MPYKNQQDRTAAVRRYREREKVKQARGEKATQIDASLGNLLRLIGFEEMTFDDLVETCYKTEKDNEGVWHNRKNGTHLNRQKQLNN